MQLFSAVVSIILAGYIGWEVVKFGPRYRQLKQELRNGDPRARTRVYKRALVFEWISALLALVALRFDWSKLNPAFLDLNGTPWLQPLLNRSAFNNGAMTGALAGVAIGTVGMIIVRLKANRKGAAPIAAGPAPWWRKLMPDFFALVPATMQERMLWAAVAISAGICEEIVFRGWLLTTLHTSLGLNGTALLLAGAVMFGLAHSYQGITGMVVTGLAGAFFCGLYVATGSLLVPILLHAAVDVRFAIMPAPFNQKQQAAYSH